MRESEQQPPRHEKAIKAMCNLGWLVVLGKDSRGNYVVQPTQDGAEVYDILVEQGCYEGIRKLLEGAS